VWPVLEHVAYLLHFGAAPEGFAMLSASPGDPRASILLVQPAKKRDLLSARALFESAGFRVVSASSFDEATRLIQTDTPDVLVTELKLGPYNGLHLVLRSRVDHPRMGVIVMSHFADTGLAEEAARQNAAFLVRPFGDRDLLNAVTRSLEGEVRG
jgi:DNA-binding NtrC family response regulator